jgi:opacity protein-like surface antigen
MKNVVTLALVFLILAPAAHAAQSVTETETTNFNSSPSAILSLNLGMGFSRISVPPSPTGKESIGNRTGMDLGVNAEIPMANQISILTGLHYVQKGVTLEASGADFDGSIRTANETFAFNYIEVPVLAQFDFPVASHSRFTVNAGPYFAFSVSKSSSATLTENGQTKDINIDSDFSKTASFDYGVRMGLGYESKIAQNLVFTVGVNYDLGIKNLDTDPAEASAGSVTTGSLLANVGLGILL